MMSNSNANALRKAFRGLHSDMQRSCISSKFVKKTVKVATTRNLPMPADMREQLLGGTSTKNTYFPEEIQDHILNEPSTATTYQFNVNDRKVVLHFVVFDDTLNTLMENKNMDEHARRVCALIHLVSAHAARPACSSTLNIYIYMTDFKKRFPTEKGQSLDAIHANTGMAYHCAKNNDVVVYRKEEWFKVLIHELFHAFGLSFIESDMEAEVHAGMQRSLQRMYAISHPVRIYETYCEIWARILNVVFDCFMGDDATTKSLNPIQATDLQLQVFMECVMDGLHENARFAQQQCAKLMRYMDITYATLANPTKENREIVSKKYRENTNIFAYYVLTCVLLHSPDEFIAWCYKNNPFRRTTPRNNIMQFRTIPSNFNGFMELLNHCKQQCPDLDSMSAHNDDTNDDVLGSSMRMSPPSPSANFMKN
uniref:Uncharacterized protein n=1 Tax=viral metagenome TaxID=1070528 RepID=A0A6C0I4I4_9ZZZZ